MIDVVRGDTVHAPDAAPHRAHELLRRAVIASAGLDPVALGAVYRGRAQFRAPVPGGRKKSGGKEAAIRQTIAERKAAEAHNDSTKPNGEGKDS